VALNLPDLEADALGRGQTLVQGDAFEAVRYAEADLHLLPHVPGPLKDYAEVHLHVGTAEVMARVAVLDGRWVEPGASRFVQLRMAEEVALAPGDRFIVRGSMAGLAGGRVTTLGGGRVLGTSNLRLRRNRPWTLAALAERRSALDDPAAWVAVVLKEAGGALSPEELARRAQVRPDVLPELLAPLREAGTVRDLGGPGGPAGDRSAEGTGRRRLVHREVVAATGRRLVEALERFHAERPMREGMEPSALAEAAGGPREVFEAALEDLLAEGTVERRGAVVALAGRGARLSDADRALKDRIARLFETAGLEPPVPAEVPERLAEGAAAPASAEAAAPGPEPAEASGEGARPAGETPDPRRVADLVRLLLDEGTLVRLGENLLMHASAVERAAGVALDLFARRGGFTTVEFRDALGTSRKFAVPLLDYFDTVRLTVRHGSRRTPGAEAKRRLG